MFMFLTEKTKTDFEHIETIFNWHVNLRKYILNLFGSIKPRWLTKFEQLFSKKNLDKLGRKMF